MDQLPCTLERCAISALITGLSAVFRKKEWTSAHSGAGQNMETRPADKTSMFFGQSYGWPLAPLGTCEVIRFRTNSPIRFLTALSPMPAKPLKTTSEAPRSEEG